MGGTSSINNRLAIRGLEDENLEITIDGAKVSNVNMFHHIGNLLINPDILKKADVQVGNNSVVHGGLGGSVAFEIKDGKDLLQNGKEYGARVQGNYNTKYRDWETDRKSTRLNSSHRSLSRMPSSA